MDGANNLKKFMKNIISNIVELIYKIGSKLNKKIPDLLMWASCKAFEKSSNYFISYNMKPKYSDEFIIKNISDASNSNIAIILQGPVRVEDNFTYETIKFYKKNCENAKIILSTWDNTNEKVLEKLRKLDITVITSKPPEFTGNGNINYQVVSTMAGIKVAKKMGCQYILKTRTDQRLYRKNLCEYFLSLLDVFPCVNSFIGINQKKRIITLQGTSGGVMFVPYFIADFMYFGDLYDIEKLFTIPLDESNSNLDTRCELMRNIKDTSTILEFYEATAPEIYIMKNYISCCGMYSIDNSVKKYWDFVKDYLICLSFSDVQLFWPKYEKHFNENEITLEFSPNDKEEVLLTYNWTFSNWLSLYCGKIIYDSSYEDISKSNASTLTFLK